MKLFYPNNAPNYLDVTLRQSILCLSFCAILLLKACTSPTENTIPNILPDAKDYLMSEIGQFCTFKCTQTTYYLGQKTSETTFLEKHQLLDVSKENKQLSVGIFRKNQTNEDWREIGRKLLLLENHKLLEIQSNQTLCILVNPIEVGTSWNLNLFNQNKAQKAKIVKYSPAEIPGNKSYDKLLEIELYKDSSALGIQKKLIKMIPSFGIIASEQWDISYCYEKECLGKGQINFGIIITYELLDYGKE